MARRAITLQKVGTAATTILYNDTVAFQTQLSGAKTAILAISHTSGSGQTTVISVWEDFFTRIYSSSPGHNVTVTSRTR